MEVADDQDKEASKIKELCLSYIQLSKSMPILKALDPKIERLTVGKDE